MMGEKISRIPYVTASKDGTFCLNLSMKKLPVFSRHETAKRKEQLSSIVDAKVLASVKEIITFSLSEESLLALVNDITYELLGAKIRKTHENEKRNSRRNF